MNALQMLHAGAHSRDAAVFCLSLMGTDYPAFLKEAYRVLSPGGQLWIAEVRKWPPKPSWPLAL